MRELLPENLGARYQITSRMFPDGFLNPETDSSINSMLEFLDKADSLLGSERYKDHIEDMAETFFNDSPLSLRALTWRTWT